MGLKELQYKAKWFLRNNKVKKISDGMYEVDKEIVTIKVKPGRIVTSCSCCNYATFVTSGQTCSHILAAYLFDTYESTFKQIKELKEQYEKYKILGFQVKPQLVIDDLIKIERSMLE